jgi:hypothetical protein
LSISFVIARSAGLAGLVSLLGAGACGSVEADGVSGRPDAAAPDAAAPDGGVLESTVSFRAAASATGESVTSLVIPAPLGVAAGDVLLAHVSNRNQVESTVAPPAGWAELRSDQSAAQLKSWILWKVATDDEPEQYAFGISVASNAAGTIVAFRGADPANPIDAASGQKNGNSAEFITPPLTTTSSGGRAVWFGAQLWAVSGCPSDRITPPEGFTGIAEECLSSPGTGLLLEAATLSLGDAGPQAQWTGSSPFAETNTAQAVALRPAGARACAPADVFSTSVMTVDEISPPGVVEPSGLAASRRNPGILYVHGESSANFVAIDQTTAEVVGSYVAGVEPFDWEDAATGPCPSGACLYMGDIGRSSDRPDPPPEIFAIYRMPEPSIAAGETTGTIAGDRFPFVYPDAPADAEALLVHPSTGDIYIVSKQATTGRSGVYRFPRPLPPPDTPSTLLHVTDLQLPIGKDESFRAVTAGAIHPCASRVLLRTYRAVYEYRAPPGSPFDDVFAAEPIPLTDTAEGQGEAIDYQADGAGYFTVAERAQPPYTLKRVPRQ